MSDVAVIRTGTANLASVLAALRRLGITPRLTADPEDVLTAERVVLPGVGAFAAALHSLRAAGLEQAITERIETARPTLAVCLGLQMLARSSEESPGVEGLGLLEVDASRFEGDVRVPHLGWNLVTPTPGATLLTEGYASYAHSYKLDALPDGWEGAWTTHGTPFIAAVERGPVLACQFHPELSGAWGADLLRRWLRMGGASC